jgi:hypothetical protein
MKISKAHQKFADRLNNQEILNHPENFLGPNWEDVINFWLYLDTLTEEQLKVVEERYMTLSDEEWDIGTVKAFDAAEATTRYLMLAEDSAYRSVSCANIPACRATEELIGLDKLLKQDHQLVFFPLFVNL